MTTTIRRGNIIDFLSYATSIDLDKRIRDSQRYIRRISLVSSAPPAPKSDTVSPLPASPVESEPEVDFLPETDTQKRTRRPQRVAVSSETARIYDRTLKDRIAALIAERGPVTSADPFQFSTKGRSFRNWHNS